MGKPLYLKSMSNHPKHFHSTKDFLIYYFQYQELSMNCALKSLGFPPYFFVPVALLCVFNFQDIYAVEEIIWGDGKVGLANKPLDIPLCGFEDEKCPSKFHLPYSET